MTLTLKVTFCEVFLVLRVFIDMTYLFHYHGQLFCSLPFTLNRRHSFWFWLYLFHVKLDWTLSFCLTGFLNSGCSEAHCTFRVKACFCPDFGLLWASVSPLCLGKEDDGVVDFCGLSHPWKVSQHYPLFPAWFIL